MPENFTRKFHPNLDRNVKGIARQDYDQRLNRVAITVIKRESDDIRSGEAEDQQAEDSGLAVFDREDRADQSQQAGDELGRAAREIEQNFIKGYFDPFSRFRSNKRDYPLQVQTITLRLVQPVIVWRGRLLNTLVGPVIEGPLVLGGKC